MQLDVADLMVFGEAASAPADDHRRLEEVRSALLPRALPSPTITHRQLPAHIQVPGEKRRHTRLKGPDVTDTSAIFKQGATLIQSPENIFLDMITFLYHVLQASEKESGMII